MSIFGEIRSLLEGGLQEPGRRIHLLTLLELTQRKDPALYAETVAPYLDGLHYAWPAPFHECKSLTRARQLRALLPRVPLKLSLHSPPPQRDMVRPAQPLAHISHLSLDLTTTTAPSLHDLFGTLKSAHIQHLSLQRSDYAHQGLPEEMAHALARTPLPGLCELDMQQCCMGDAAAHIFAAQASWPRLTRLLLNNPGFRSGGLRALSGASFFPQLEHLRLSCTLPYTPGAAAHTPPDEAPEMCARGPLALRSLDLTHARHDARFFRALATSHVTPHLHTLHASHTPMGDAGMLALCESSALPRLHTLSAAHTGLTSASLGSLHLSALPPSLRALDLCGNATDDEAITSLARSPWCAHLEALHLSHLPTTSVTGPCADLTSAEATTALLRALNPARIRQLSLRACTFSADLISALERLDQLEHLNLAGAHIPPHLYARLLSLPFPHLETLTLRATHLTAPLLKTFTQARSRPHLRHLDVSHNPLGDTALCWVLEPERLPALTHLHMDDTQLSEHGARQILKAADAVKRLEHFSLYSNDISPMLGDALLIRYRYRVLANDIPRIG